MDLHLYAQKNMVMLNYDYVFNILKSVNCIVLTLYYKRNYTSNCKLMHIFSACARFLAQVTNI